jgi:hypothetical protein
MECSHPPHLFATHFFAIRLTFTPVPWVKHGLPDLRRCCGCPTGFLPFGKGTSTVSLAIQHSSACRRDYERPEKVEPGKVGSLVRQEPRT